MLPQKIFITVAVSDEIFYLKHCLYLRYISWLCDLSPSVLFLANQVCATLHQKSSSWLRHLHRKPSAPHSNDERTPSNAKLDGDEIGKNTETYLHQSPVAIYERNRNTLWSLHHGLWGLQENCIWNRHARLYWILLVHDMLPYCKFIHRDV